MAHISYTESVTTTKE